MLFTEAERAALRNHDSIVDTHGIARGEAEERIRAGFSKSEQAAIHRIIHTGPTADDESVAKTACERAKIAMADWDRSNPPPMNGRGQRPDTSHSLATRINESLETIYLKLSVRSRSSPPLSDEESNRWRDELVRDLYRESRRDALRFHGIVPRIPEMLPEARDPAIGLQDIATMFEAVSSPQTTVNREFLPRWDSETNTLVCGEYSRRFATHAAKMIELFTALAGPDGVLLTRIQDAFGAEDGKLSQVLRNLNKAADDLPIKLKVKSGFLYVSVPMTPPDLPSGRATKRSR